MYACTVLLGEVFDGQIGNVVNWGPNFIELFVSMNFSIKILANIWRIFQLKLQNQRIFWEIISKLKLLKLWGASQKLKTTKPQESISSLKISPGNVVGNPTLLPHDSSLIVDSWDWWGTFKCYIKRLRVIFQEQRYFKSPFVQCHPGQSWAHIWDILLLPITFHVPQW